jgi:hypothetical protein
MLTDAELDRIRAHATANPGHAGDVVLRLVAEVERLKASEAAHVADGRAILARMRARKGTSGEGMLSISDIVALKRIAGER